MSCYECRFYTGEDLAACGWNPQIAASSPEEGCWEFQPDPNPWGFWEGKLLNPSHELGELIGSVPVDGWKYMVSRVPYWTTKNCVNCAYSGLIKNPEGTFKEVCAVNPRHVANTLLATAPFGGYQCPHWEPQNSGYKPVQLVVRGRHNYSLIAALAASALAIVAIATIGLTQTFRADNDPYELSPPGSVQHIRED